MSKFFLRKNKKDDDPKIKVLSKPDELACGGTYSYIEIEASKQIDSNDMILFDVTSALGSGHMIFDSDGVAAERLGYISAFAAPAQGGTFMFISKGEGFHRSQPKYFEYPKLNFLFLILRIKF